MSHLANPFAPDLHQGRHQHPADEKPDNPHRLHFAHEPEDRREERKLDRSTDERRTDRLVDNEELQGSPGGAPGKKVISPVAIEKVTGEGTPAIQ